MTICKPALLPMLFATLVGGCATSGDCEVPIPKLAVEGVVARLEAGHRVQLEGWVHFRGEVILYDSREAMSQSLVFPYCISGFLDQSLSDMSAPDLDGRKVRVSGTLLKFEHSEDQEGTISTWSVIDGVPLKNWCLGSYVLKIDELAEL
jgi:hypothetical protein